MKKAIRHPPIAVNFPGFLHGGDYNPEQWLKWKDTIWKEDMRLAKLAGINSFSIGIFAWAALEPVEGEYHFEWLDEMMDLLAENRMAAVLATPSGARPAWMSAKYPEVIRVNEMRRRNLYGERHNHCPSSPVYREKVAAINTRLAERYKNHPALAVWHVSNEYGGECHCPLCQERFRAHLKKRFGSLDALNEAWWTSFWSHTYTDWSHIESPSPLGDTHTHGLNLEWKRFTTEQVVDFYLHETAPLKKITPDVPCTTNLMCDKDGTDYFRLAEVMDVAGWDNYPEWTATEKDIDIASYRSFAHDLTRSLKDKPFMLIESSPSATNWRSVAKLHRPGVHTLQSMQAVAHGSDTVQYFQFRKSRGSCEKFHGAVVDHEGTENTRVFREVADVGRRLAAMKGVAGTATPSSAAIIYDWNVLWALADAKGFLQEKTGYKETVVSHYRALWGLGISTDVIDQTRSLEGYALIVAPMLYMLRPGFAEKIASFVQSGGVFAATYGTGYVDENDLCYLGGFPGPLKDVLGIWSEEIDALYPDDRNYVFWDNRMRTYRIFDFCERIHPLTAQTFLTYGSDFYQGEPVVTVNKYGSGAAWYIAARTEQAFLNDFYAYIVREYHIPQIIDAELPEGVTAQVRSDGKTRYIFLLNFTPDIKFVETKDGVKKLQPWEAVEIVDEQGDRL